MLCWFFIFNPHFILAVYEKIWFCLFLVVSQFEIRTHVQRTSLDVSWLLFWMLRRCFFLFFIFLRSVWFCIEIALVVIWYLVVHLVIGEARLQSCFSVAKSFFYVISSFISGILEISGFLVSALGGCLLQKFHRTQHARWAFSFLFDEAASWFMFFNQWLHRSCAGIVLVHLFNFLIYANQIISFLIFRYDTIPCLLLRHALVCTSILLYLWWFGQLLWFHQVFSDECFILLCKLLLDLFFMLLHYLLLLSKWFFFQSNQFL